MSTDQCELITEERRQAPTLSWLTTLGIALLVLVFSTVVVEIVFYAGRLAYSGGQPPGPAGALSLVFRTTASLILQMTILTSIIRMYGHRIAKYFDLRLPRIRDAIVGITALSGLLLIKYGLAYYNGGVLIMPADLEKYQSASSAGVVPLLFVAMVVVAPLGEELVFRGFLFRGFSATRIGTVGAIAITTALWTAMHLNYGLAGMIFITILGVLFGWIRARSQSVLLTWLLHGMTNLTLLVIIAAQIGPYASGRAHSIAFSNACLLDIQGKDYTRAIKDCTESIGYDSGYARPYANRGMAYQQLGDFNKAIPDFTEALRNGNFANDREHSVVLMDRCGAYETTKDNTRAIEDCTEAIRLDHANAQAQINRGLAYYQSGDLDHAIADFDEAIRLNPKLVSAYSNRGLAHAGKGDKPQAVADFDKAIEIDPKHAAAYNDRGLVYASSDDDRAIADFSRAIELQPKFVQAYNNRGLVYSRKNDLDRALADHNRAIDLDPKNAVSYVFRGDAYRHNGYPPKAVADYDQAIALDPKFADAYESRANALRDIGYFDGAIADYSRVISLNANYIDAYYARGLAEIYVGALSKAVADLTQAAKLNPKDAYTAIWLEIVNKRSNLPSRLKEMASVIDRVQWPAPVIRLYLDEISAAEALAAAADPSPDTKKGQICEANFYNGELELQQGSKIEAARLLKLAAADCPKTFDEFSSANAEIKALGIH